MLHLISVSDNKTLQSVNKMGELSDGFHTFDELYHYRALYHAAFANQLYMDYQDHDTVEGVPIKSHKHSDGKYCFDSAGEWFVVTINLPTGQITNHYHSDYWDLFNCSASEQAPEWDGHTPQQAAERLEKYLRGDWAN
jgi:hypothetical protein